MRFHTNLPVEDLEATVAFYRVLFDREPTKQKPDYAKFLPDGGLNISFHQAAGASGALQGLHLGLEFESKVELDEAFTRLARAGVVTANRESAICCYANQDKFWVTDPNGYEWELYTLIEDTEQKMSDTTACCPGSAQLALRHHSGIHTPPG